MSVSLNRAFASLPVLVSLGLCGCSPDRPPPSGNGDTGAAEPEPAEPCVPGTWFRDADGDGHGDPYAAMEGCPAPDGYVADGTDCDDADPTAFPGQVWYADLDGDGFGDPGHEQARCTRPDGFVADATDCDDVDSSKNPATDWYTDADADGYGDAGAPLASCDATEADVANADDCDDADAEVHPAATEVCDAYVDNDCNGLADQDDPGLELRSRQPLFRDADSDGWGSEEYLGDHCPSSGIGVVVEGDCDDGDAAINPDRLELPDEVDQNCDGETYYHYIETLPEGLGSDTLGDNTEGFGPRLWSSDLDSDGDQDLILGYPYADSNHGELAWWDESSAADFAPATRLKSWTGAAEGSKLGGVAAAVGDLDGDGVEDLLVLDHAQAPDGFTVHLFSSATPSGVLSSTTASWEFDANPLGAQLLSVGDIDSDGLPEALIGQNNGVEYSRGRLYVVDADDLGTSTDPATLDSLEGPGFRSAFGTAMARVSDADGDGAPEVLVGSAAAQQNRAHLLTAADFAAGSASESATFYGHTDFYGTGEFVGGVGDLDGDGYGDFGIYSYNGTSYRDTGAIHFFYGRADILEGALLTGEDARLVGEAYEHSFGGANGLRHFHGAGDMDGDGNDDLVVGVPYYDFGTGRDQGAVYGILGRRLSGTQTADAVADFVLRGDRSYTGPGIGVARGGDRDGDGRDDLWLGANHLQTADRGGTVYFFGSELVP